LNIPKKNGVLNICFDNEAVETKLSTDNMIKKHPDIAAAGNYSYAATACPSHPFDLIEKVRKAFENSGNTFIHILCPCPPEWGFESHDSVRIGRMAVETRIFPLYEISNGYYQITINEPNTRPVSHYLKKQTRFSGLRKKAVEELNVKIKDNFQKLTEKASIGI
jgi:pyruvate ferredoxin oxidoreductase beta subunit